MDCSGEAYRPVGVPAVWCKLGLVGALGSWVSKTRTTTSGSVSAPDVLCVHAVSYLNQYMAVTQISGPGRDSLGGGEGRLTLVLLLLLWLVMVTTETERKEE